MCGATVHKATMMDKMTSIFFLGMIMISYFFRMYGSIILAGQFASIFLGTDLVSELLTDKPDDM